MSLVFLKALILGVVQGLTEFLPVSSSGHLVIAQNLFGLREPEVFFDLALHFGTLIAVVCFYRVEVFGMVLELRHLRHPGEIPVRYRTSPLFRLGALVLLGSVPTALIGIFFMDFFMGLFASTFSAGICLFVTAAFLLASSFRGKVLYKSELEFPALLAILVGIAQGLAIAPGLSRSGVTIALAIILGCDRILAARYSFPLSIPAIVGGLILQIPKASVSEFPPGATLVGFVAAALVGYLSLKLLSFLLAKDRLVFFAPWCVAAGLAAIFARGLA